MNKAATFNNLATTVMQSSARAIIEASDFVYRLWPDGEIAEASFGPGLVKTPVESDLAGRRFADIAAPGDAASLIAIVEAARNGQVADSITVEHSELIGSGTAGRYSAHLSSDGKNIVVVGASVSSEILLATQTVDAEIARYRRIDRERLEAEYRQIFQLSAEGLMVINTDTGLIEEANGNAAAILGRPVGDLIGSLFTEIFDSEDAEGDVTEDGARNNPDQLSLTVKAPGTNRPIAVTTQVARGIEWSFMVVRLAQAGADLSGQQPATKAETVTSPVDQMTIELLRTADFPVALAGGNGLAVWTNTAMDRLSGDTAAIGQKLSDLLGVPELALEMVFRNADEHRRLLTSLSALESRLSVAGDAHVMVVPIPAGPTTGYGVVIHMVSPSSDRGGAGSRQSHDALADLVGQAPLKELVRRSTDVIESKCIEAALRLTGNNRAAAASVLGLSRQSLYIKLRQHDLL